MSFRLQEFIHKFEEGAGSRYLKYVLGCIALVALAVMYNGMAFRNLATVEGMDAAQLARNISEGKGYTTDFIRPFSIYLLNRRQGEGTAETGVAGIGGTNGGALEGGARTGKLPHPDVANPPVYPYLLAAVLKLNPFGTPDLSAVQNFTVYKPDLWIAMFNQALFVVAACLAFGLARRLFDEPVAWISTVAFVGAELFWRFSISGLSTLLLIVIFLGAVRALVGLETASRDDTVSPGKLTMLALVVGGLMGLGGLTRYGFGWLIIPVVGWLASLPGKNRMTVTLTAALAFVMVMGPWVLRNYSVSGTPFGTAGYAIYQDTAQFAEHQLERSLNPDFSTITAPDLSRKLLVNTREILENDLPKLGGSWVSALFLVGLLMPFRNPTLGRLRWFLVSCLVLLAVVQALGRTELSKESPAINSENLLVVVAPLVFIYGVSLLFTLVGTALLQAPASRYFVLGTFCLVASAPLVFTFLGPSPSPIVYPPYYPPWIQEKAGLMEDHELIMTDIPWAVAWYGQRPSVWLTLSYRNEAAARSKSDFYELSRRFTPVQALYLSSRAMKTLEVQTLWHWVREESREQDWENFILMTFLKKEVPTGFPLQRAPHGLVPELFLTDSERSPGKGIKPSE